MDGAPAGSAREAGSTIAGYRIDSLLGEGGMGVVYLAERPQGGLCALKVLSARVAAGDASFATRFRREAEYAEALNHPHILELYEAGEAPDGTLFYAMQYVRGADLGARLARNGPIGLAQAISILGQVGDALDCAHAKGILHRDVKPGNIIVAEDGGSPQAYLTDFGLSKNPSEDSVALTRQGQFIGTSAYTAPEEILAQPRGYLVDIYSLGCVLYETLVGAPPFVRDSDLDLLYAHIGDPRPNVSDARADLPPQIDAVVAKAMAISPAERYESCAKLIAAASALIPGGDGREPAVLVTAGPALSASSAREASAPAVAPTPAIVSPPPPVASQSPGPSLSPVASTRALEPLRVFVREGPGRGRELVVDDEVVLGRMTTLDGALAGDVRISRRHGRITRSADGGLVVEDAYSSNGTHVNGIRIAGPHPLADGDELRVGSTVFVVTSERPSTEVGAEAEPPAPDAAPLSAAVDEAPRADDAPFAQPLESLAPRVAGAPVSLDANGGSPSVTAELPVASASTQASTLVVRLELDLQAGELAVAIEGGDAVRIVRSGDGWRMEPR